MNAACLRECFLPGLLGCFLIVTGLQPAAAQTHHARGLTIRLKHMRRDGNCHIILQGSPFDDFLDGSNSSCDEDIAGRAGNDILIGGAGNNTLDGGPGADVMTGGPGADTFVYQRAGDSPPDAPDLITDFTESGPNADKIDLAGVARRAGVKLTFIGWSGFSGTPGEVGFHIVQFWMCRPPDWRCQNVYYTIIEADLTGNGTPDFAIDLMGQHFLTADDFILEG